MLKHRLLAAAALLVIAFGSGGRTEAGQPIWFYRAESPAHHITYFYPSFHLRDERVPRPPEAVLDNRTQLVLEADIAQARAHPELLTPYMLNPKPLDLAAYFTPAEIAGIRARAACNGVAPIVERLRLSFISMFVALPCPKPNAGTYEELMEAAAQQRGLKIAALESAEEQLAALASLPDRLAIEGIKEYSVHPERAERLIERMITLYNAGKYDALYRLAIENGPKNAADNKLFLDKIVVERNRLMVKRMAGMLEEGNALIVIGALHFPGKDGIVDLLRRQGFTVAEIDASSGKLQ